MPRKIVVFMFSLLYLGAPESDVNEYFGELLKSVRQQNAGYTLEMANKVYVQQGLPLLGTFKATLARHYGSQLEESVDFTKSAATAEVPALVPSNH
jgi:serine protease inhibitor